MLKSDPEETELNIVVGDVDSEPVERLREIVIKESK